MRLMSIHKNTYFNNNKEYNNMYSIYHHARSTNNCSSVMLPCIIA